MKKKNKSEFIVEKSRCERCGNEYPPFQVIEDRRTKDEGFYPNCECIVEIKLKKWQIPILLGAAALGDIIEGILSRLVEAEEEGTYRLEEVIPMESDSFRWIKHVDAIIDQIKNQTDLNLEYIESLSRNNVLEQINKLVGEEVQKRCKQFGGHHLNRRWVWRDYPDADEV